MCCCMNVSVCIKNEAKQTCRGAETRLSCSAGSGRGRQTRRRVSLKHLYGGSFIRVIEHVTHAQCERSITVTVPFTHDTPVPTLMVAPLPHTRANL